MSSKIQQQTDGQPHTDAQNPPGLAFFITMYILYHGVLLLAMTYMFTLIMFYDALANKEYIISDIAYWSGNGLTTAVVILYLLYALLSVYFTLKFTRHAFGVCISTVNYTLIYVILVINQNINNSCKYREFLTCHEETSDYNLNDSVLIFAKNIILCVMAGLFLLQIGYFAINYICYYKTKYYFSNNCFKEFMSTMAFYYITSFIITIIPLLCCCGCGGSGDGGDSSWSGVEIGNMVEGHDCAPLEAGIDVV